MKPGELPASAWEFRSAGVNYRVQWSWKRFEKGHFAREASEFFPTLSEAMADARRHGFRDAFDSFSIV
jgi:hypothetical protein